MPAKFDMMSLMKLLSTSNAKLEKGEKFGYLSYGLSLAPSTLSGKNFCSHASAGCKAACLNTAGMGVYKTVQAGRLRRARLFIENRAGFLAQLEKEIEAAVKRANKVKLTLCVRLNVLSDLPFENLGIIQKFPSVQFYDYTANPKRAISFLNKELPANYHLTFSRKESNQAQTELLASMGMNIAAVFASMPENYLNKPVIDGDESDLRFLDSKGVIVGLKAKGKARKDTSGFVIK